MEDLRKDVYNEPQPDGTVIQYDLQRKIIAHFSSDKACADAMGIELPADIPPIREEIRDGVDYVLNGISRISHNVLGERPHAA